MKDEVITALWKIKEDIAREHDYDMDRLGTAPWSAKGSVSMLTELWTGPILRGGPSMKSRKFRNPTPSIQPTAPSNRHTYDSAQGCTRGHYDAGSSSTADEAPGACHRTSGLGYARRRLGTR